MAEHVFEFPKVEEFYNSCHTKTDGRFCGATAKGKSVSRVPMSEGARRSNAILRGLAAARKSGEYKNAKSRIKDTWANREKGQGGLRGTKGTNSKKADAARAANAKGRNPANKDGSTKLSGGFKITGNKGKDVIQISQLDRGSAARKAATKKFEAAYTKKTAETIRNDAHEKRSAAQQKPFADFEKSLRGMTPAEQAKAINKYAKG